MLYEFLKETVERHLDETLPLIEQLTEVDIMSQPTPGVREIGEVVLHLIRSLEYYMQGIVKNQWESLPYTLEKYDSAESIINLTKDVFERVKQYMNIIPSMDLSRVIDSFNRPATVGEIILEMVEHSIHHRGQITVYYRLLDIKPNSIPYII
ncbi:MAG: DinB family protein [Candidatus Thorarchaeota archaeon]